MVCFLALFAERLMSKITFKILGVDFNPKFQCPVFFFSQINQHVKEWLYGNFEKNRGAHSLRIFFEICLTRVPLGEGYFEPPLSFSCDIF